MSRKSWDTSTMPPSKLLMACASESMASRSRWFVGSSSSSCKISKTDGVGLVDPDHVGSPWQWPMAVLKGSLPRWG